jgi:hypothetical protein
MTTYKIQEREAGNVIETGLTLAEAKNMITKFEKDDEKNGNFEQDFYEITEE